MELTMEKIKVLIADDNREFCEMVKGYLEKQHDIEIVGVAYDGLDACRRIELSRPDVVLLDDIMPKLDGIGVLERLERGKTQKPLCIMLSAVGQENMAQQAIELGAEYFMVKPVDMECVTGRIRQMTGKARAKMTLLSGKNKELSFGKNSEGLSLEARVTKVLHDVGVPAHIRGYNYMREAIILSTTNQEVLNYVTKELYPAVADKCGTKPSRVERAIRHAIEVAWSRGKVEAIDKIFGYTINSNKGKPTNSEFIALIADMLRLEILEEAV